MAFYRTAFVPVVALGDGFFHRFSRPANCAYNNKNAVEIVDSLNGIFLFNFSAFSFRRNI